METIALDDSRYPPLLAAIHDPPQKLFVRGTLYIERPCLAVVGPRKASLYGKQVTEMLIPPLVASGLTIVSGLAFGIDAAAHEATLRVEGYTVAVLGSGIDPESVTPHSHRGLADRIVAAGGAVISEYPPGTPSTPYTYPKRNRIIAGLSLGTLVIEAGEKSGALITAACALDNNRDVFAIPQNITAVNAVGVNRLIAMGANPVTSPDDILSVLGLDAPTEPARTRASKQSSLEETAILNCLSKEPRHVDDIIVGTKLKSQTVMSTLTLLEIHGAVKNLGGMMYTRL